MFYLLLCQKIHVCVLLVRVVLFIVAQLYLKFTMHTYPLSSVRSSGRGHTCKLK